MTDADEARWIPEGGLLAAACLAAGGAVAALAGGVFLALDRATAAPDRLALALLSLPPAPLDGAGYWVAQSGAGPLVVVDILAPLGLAAVGWWATGRRVAEWPTFEYPVGGSRREPHRLLAKWVGRGLGRLLSRLDARSYPVAVGQTSLAVGAGYAVVVAALVWRAGGLSDGLGDPAIETVLSGLFAALWGLVGCLARGCYGE